MSPIPPADPPNRWRRTDTDFREVRVPAEGDRLRPPRRREAQRPAEVVVSTTLTAPEGPGTTVVGGDLAKEVTALELPENP